MAGEKNLSVLIKNMDPHLHDEVYVFVSFPHNEVENQRLATPLATFIEKEGVSMVLDKEQALVLGVDYEQCYRCITLNVHSDLDAVGLTAAFANCLAEANISANVVAGFYHDHIFVNEKDAENAMSQLNALSQRTC